MKSIITGGLCTAHDFKPAAASGKSREESGGDDAMKVAIEGCAHGDLTTIYNSIKHTEEANNMTVDLLICCGDFQALIYSISKPQTGSTE